MKKKPIFKDLDLGAKHLVCLSGHIDISCSRLNLKKNVARAVARKAWFTNGPVFFENWPLNEQKRWMWRITRQGIDANCIYMEALKLVKK